jgi:6-phosphofructo-2-kinase/fructose-2,6-biphosphatase
VWHLIQIWTSTLQRSILTAQPIIGFPKIQWRALDEINAGICDGMTYDEIKKIKPEEYESRSKDKLRYRYPRGESYLDVIQRLEPVIIELERQRAPVVVISHQAVLRALYAYFADKPLEELPNIEVRQRFAFYITATLEHHARILHFCSS